MKAESVMLFGCLYEHNNVSPNPAKVDAIAHMPHMNSWEWPCTWATSYCGSVTFWHLLESWPEKDDTFIWNTTLQCEFNQITIAISTTMTLCYFNASQSFILQSNASQTGLGATIFQNDRLVTYVTKARHSPPLSADIQKLRKTW